MVRGGRLLRRFLWILPLSRSAELRERNPAMVDVQRHDGREPVPCSPSPGAARAVATATVPKSSARVKPAMKKAFPTFPARFRGGAATRLPGHRFWYPFAKSPPAVSAWLSWGGRMRPASGPRTGPAACDAERSEGRSGALRCTGAWFACFHSVRIAPTRSLSLAERANPLANGITEGFHNKMEMISRRAFGFRNFGKTPRLRVRALCA